MVFVIDTNCLLAAIPSKSRHKWLYDAFEEGKFEWAVSNEVLTEYAEIITSYFGKKVASYVLKSLVEADNVVFTNPHYKWSLMEKDPDDNKFVDLAISVRAKAIVTEDKHFNVLSKLPFPKVLVWKLDSFRKHLKK